MPRKPRVYSAPPTRRAHRATYKPARKPGDEVTWTWVKRGIIANGNGIVLALLHPFDQPAAVLANLGVSVPAWDVRAPARATELSYLIKMCKRVARYTGTATPCTWLYYAIPCTVVDAGEAGPGVAAVRPPLARHRPPKLIGDGKRVDLKLPTSLLKPRAPELPAAEAPLSTPSRFIVTPRAKPSPKRPSPPAGSPAPESQHKGVDDANDNRPMAWKRKR